ncbi:MAG TPA: chemotaxis protein CheD, partial [Pseudomonadales bacterium]|nr:chemotaxis protein CheD [Pseudomonadales bacterium]
TQWSHQQEIFLHPGEVFFGERKYRIHTLLGSCVALTVWHPVRRVGGMCHCLLPRPAEHRLDPAKLDGRYACDAIELLLKKMRDFNTRKGEYQVKLFGGAHVNAGTNLEVGVRNIEAARQLVKAVGLVIGSEHVGGKGHRRIIFDISTGDVWLKHETQASTDMLCVTGKKVSK